MTTQTRRAERTRQSTQISRGNALSRWAHCLQLAQGHVLNSQLCRLVRSILSDKPRVTRFPVEWDTPEQVPTVGGEPQQEDTALPAADAAMDEEQFPQQRQFGEQSNGFSFFPGMGLPEAGAVNVGGSMEE